MRRHKLSRGKSKRSFSRNAVKKHKRNFASAMRGGYRI